ncbi:MAG: hypothetical protein Q3971_04360 [Moraxella sp.]|nr:hypothetical protein [Moraxella sp.]
MMHHEINHEILRVARVWLCVLTGGMIGTLCHYMITWCMQYYRSLRGKLP